jgi:hypothetical protein
MALKAKVSTGSYGPFYWTQYDLVGHPRTRIVVQSDRNDKSGPGRKPFWYIYFISGQRGLAIGGAWDRERATSLVRKFLEDAPKENIFAYAESCPVLGEQPPFTTRGLKGGIFAQGRSER